MGEEKPGLPELPVIEEKELGVREYWYETFRRVLVIPLVKKNCYLLSIDVYKRLEPGNTTNLVPINELSVQGSHVSLQYYKLGEDLARKASIRGVQPFLAEVVAVSSSEGLEISNVRLQYCGLDTAPSYEEVRSVYREVVKRIEGRDPELEPLDSVLRKDS